MSKLMSKAHINARNRRYRHQHKDHYRYLTWRSKARCFLRSRATLSDLKELHQVAINRVKYLKSHLKATNK